MEEAPYVTVRHIRHEAHLSLASNEIVEQLTGGIAARSVSASISVQPGSLAGIILADGIDDSALRLTRISITRPHAGEVRDA